MKQAAKHCLFVGHLAYGRNNVYEESLVGELSCRFETLQVVSVNKSRDIPQQKDNQKIWFLPAVRRPFIDEIVRLWSFFWYGFRWCRKHTQGERIMILLSAPLEVNQGALWLRRLFRIKTVNLIIDTALGNVLTDSLWDTYTRWCFSRAERLCCRMDASMALNRRVFPYLKLEDKPCLLTRIGHRYPEPKFTYTATGGAKKTILYTGTLTYYDGTKELLEAMTLLNPDDYELQIYGKGPEESLVRQYQERYPHIRLMGYVPYTQMPAIMAGADLLINPRIDNPLTDVFGFPSKMVEYLLSGTPVLTTRFAALPEDYLPFIHTIEEQNAVGIAAAIETVFHTPEDVRKKMCAAAYDHVFKKHNYKQIADEMLTFFDSIQIRE